MRENNMKSVFIMLLLLGSCMATSARAASPAHFSSHMPTTIAGANNEALASMKRLNVHLPTPANHPIIIDVAIFMIGSDIHVDLGSLVISGDPVIIDLTSTPELFDIIANVAVTKALALGYISCPGSCANTNPPVHVCVPSCVSRLEKGTATRFAACGAPNSFCVHDYSICCLAGLIPTITLQNTYVVGAACVNGGGCEGTCR